MIDIENEIESLRTYTSRAFRHPKKNCWTDSGLVLDGPPHMLPDGYIDNVIVGGGGALCVSRKALLAMCEYYKENWYIDIGSAYKEKTYALFEMKIIDNRLISEDYNFCMKWRNMGNKIYCNPNMQMGHIGQEEYFLNYKNQLDSQRLIAEYNKPDSLNKLKNDIVEIEI